MEGCAEKTGISGSTQVGEIRVAKAGNLGDSFPGVHSLLKVKEEVDRAGGGGVCVES